MRWIAAPAVVLLVLLAGCGEEPYVPDPMEITSSSTSTTGSGAFVGPPTVEAMNLSFDGNLGTFVHGCVFPTNTCDTVDAQPDGGDLVATRPGANLTSLVFEVTWTATTPATQTLTVGSLVYEECDGCNSTFFPEVEGTSPLRVEVTGLAVPFTETSSIHIFVYNGQGFVYDPNVPAYGLVSVDQAYHIEGVATFLVPAAAT